MKKILLTILSVIFFGGFLNAQCVITHIEFQIDQTLESKSDIKLELFDNENQKLEAFMWEGKLTKDVSKVFGDLSIPVGGAAKYFWKLTEFDLLFNDDYGSSEALHLNSSKHATFLDQDKNWQVIVRVDCP